MPRPRKLTEFTEPTITVPLDERGQHAKALELATVTQEIDTAKSDLAASASVARKHIRALALRQRHLAECVRTGCDKQPAQLELGGAR